MPADRATCVPACRKCHTSDVQDDGMMGKPLPPSPHRSTRRNPSTSGVSDGADDGIRTRAPHLGKCDGIRPGRRLRSVEQAVVRRFVRPVRSVCSCPVAMVQRVKRSTNGTPPSTPRWTCTRHSANERSNRDLLSQTSPRTATYPRTAHRGRAQARPVGDRIGKCCGGAPGDAVLAVGVRFPCGHDGIAFTQSTGRQPVDCVIRFLSVSSPLARRRFLRRRRSCCERRRPCTPVVRRCFAGTGRTATRPGTTAGSWLAEERRRRRHRTCRSG